mgnify:CR=1 FL=1
MRCRWVAAASEATAMDRQPNPDPPLTRQPLQWCVMASARLRAAGFTLRPDDGRSVPNLTPTNRQEYRRPQHDET